MKSLNELNDKLKQIKEVETKVRETGEELGKYADLEEAKKALGPADDLIKRIAELQVRLKAD